MQLHRYSRYQRRHNHFVLEHDGQYLAVKQTGEYGFTGLKQASVYNYKAAEQLQRIVNEHLNIQILAIQNGKYTAL